MVCLDRMVSCVYVYNIMKSLKRKLWISVHESAELGHVEEDGRIIENFHVLDMQLS